MYGRVAARLARVPVVVNTQHGLYATDADRLARRVVVYGLERFAAAWSDVELVQNPEDLATLARLGVRRSKLWMLGNGIDLQRFRPRPEVRAEVRAELGIDESEVVVGAVGRLVREKGYVELFEAAASLRAGHPRLRWIVAGPQDGSKGDALTEDEMRAGRDAGVTLLGERSDPERLYQAMDLYVLASHREGWPRSAMEASACGVPVIATAIRGCRQVVQDGENGLLVPPRAADALAAAVARLTDDGELRRRMAARGPALAAARFDQATVIGLSLDAYRSNPRPRGARRSRDRG